MLYVIITLLGCYTAQIGRYQRYGTTYRCLLHGGKNFKVYLRPVTTPDRKRRIYLHTARLKIASLVGPFTGTYESALSSCAIAKTFRRNCRRSKNPLSVTWALWHCWCLVAGLHCKVLFHFLWYEVAQLVGAPPCQPEGRGSDFHWYSPSGRPPLWPSGQSFWLQIQRSRVRFPALPDFSE